MNPRLRQVLLYGAAGLAAVVALLILALALMDWDWLRGPIARALSARSGRTVTISGHLRAHLWSRTPTLTVQGLRVANPPWEPSRPLLQLQQLQVQIDLGALLRGHLVLPRVAIDQPDLYLHQEISGRANWTDANTAPTSATATAAKPFKLPAIHELIINSGKVVLLDDPHRLNIHGTIQAHEHAAAADPQALHIEGQGSINDEPFALDVSGGALLVVDSKHPYPFKLSIQAGQNEVTASGEVLKPFNLGQLTLQVAARGPDLAQLYYLTHLALPNSPPYQLQAQISRDGQRFEVRNIKGTLGRSDISGSVSVDATHQRPNLTATLKSGHLLLSDLGALTGSRASAPSLEPGSAAPARKMLLPDAHLATNRVKAMDADVTFNATDIEAGKVPFSHVNLHATLKDGVLALDPVQFVMPQGRLSGVIRIDARTPVPAVHMELRATDISLDQLKGKGPASAAPLGGILQARAVISGKGDSVHSLMADADGRLVAVIPHGDIRAAFAELTGIDLKGIGLLLTKNEQRAPIRCGVARFDITDGTASATSLVLDTQDVLITGKGNIDFGTEKLDLALQGQPKKFHLVRVRAPVDIKGQLVKPTFGPDKGKLIKQGGIAAALGTLLTPVAAMLAFVDPGLAKDQDCSALLHGADSK
ncbi:MAG TPA: AsmA family protein [Steroidobacteraceae bacterium]|nr:AsmA family protein [Steroidobacteraceae bacterium]